MYRGIGGQDRAVAKVPEAFSVGPFRGIAPDNWRQKFQGVIDGNAWRNEPV
jgi:hypothetical protein